MRQPGDQVQHHGEHDAASSAMRQPQDEQHGQCGADAVERGAVGERGELLVIDRRLASQAQGRTVVRADMGRRRRLGGSRRWPACRVAGRLKSRTGSIGSNWRRSAARRGLSAQQGLPRERGVSGRRTASSSVSASMARGRGPPRAGPCGRCRRAPPSRRAGSGRRPVGRATGGPAASCAVTCCTCCKPVGTAGWQWAMKAPPWGCSTDLSAPVSLCDPRAASRAWLRPRRSTPGSAPAPQPRSAWAGKRRLIGVLPLYPRAGRRASGGRCRWSMAEVGRGVEAGSGR